MSRLLLIFPMALLRLVPVPALAAPASVVTCPDASAPASVSAPAPASASTHAPAIGMTYSDSSLHALPQADSTDFASLDASLDEYLAALEPRSADEKCAETDFIISACTDPAVLRHVACRVYDHYYSSKLMGDDAVAVHVFDRWFADGGVKMEDEGSFFAANLFATANRNSLIGMAAPQLELLSPEGLPVAAPGDGGRYRILFFYDVGCPKCLVESMILRNLIEARDYPLILFAVYVGSERERWDEYRAEHFAIDSPHLETVHAWDPDLQSGLSLQYGVVSTPKMFLVDPEGVIVGRGLDGEALEKLLDLAFIPKTLDYGSDESMQMYDGVFAQADDNDCGAVGDVASEIEGRLLPRGDTLLFRQMTGDLLYFLTSRKEARFKCGSEAFIDRYILSRDDVWKTADDTVKVVNLALFVKDLLNLCPVGSPLPELTVPAEVLGRGGRSRTASVRLDRLKDCAVMFYTEGCALCDAEREAARALLGSGAAVPGTDIVPKRAVLIDMDEIWNSGGTLVDALMTRFDLSSLPFILVTDGRGLVVRKYVTFR